MITQFRLVALNVSHNIFLILGNSSELVKTYRKKYIFLVTEDRRDVILLVVKKFYQILLKLTD